MKINKTKIGIVAIAIVLIAGIASMNMASAINNGANVNAFVFYYTGVNDIAGSNSMELSLTVLYQDKVNGYDGSFDPEQIWVTVNLNQPAQLDNKIIDGIVADATARGYNLVASDVYIPTYQKGYT